MASPKASLGPRGARLYSEACRERSAHVPRPCRRAGDWGAAPRPAAPPACSGHPLQQAVHRPSRTPGQSQTLCCSEPGTTASSQLAPCQSQKPGHCSCLFRSPNAPRCPLAHTVLECQRRGAPAALPVPRASGKPPEDLSPPRQPPPRVTGCCRRESLPGHKPRHHCLQMVLDGGDAFWALVQLGANE